MRNLKSILLGGSLLVFAGMALAAGNVAGDAAVSGSGKKQVTFDVWEYRVTGNTLLNNKQIERTVYAHLGPHRTIEDVEAARVALETLYNSSGFPTVVVNLPEQNVTQGVVTLEVVEGKVDRTRITGSRYFSLGEIRREVPGLATGEVPYLPEVRDQLASLNAANNDRQVSPVFRPGRTPGTVEVELQVKDELPLHGSLELNNHNSPDTSRLRLIGTLSYDNLWQRLHSASVTYQISPEELDEVRVLAGTYVMPAGGGSDRLAFYAIRSKSDSEVASAGALSVIGKGSIYGGRWIVPFASGRDRFNSVTLGLDWKDFKESTVLTGSDTSEIPIDYSVLTAQYSNTLLGDSSRTTFSIGGHAGLRGLGNSETEFEQKRVGASANFAYLDGALDHEYRLQSGIRLVGIMHGQLSGQPLISNEQFSAGGFESVRGYHESEVLSDDGLQASFEVHSPSYELLPGRWFGRFNALVFADGALLKIQDPLPGQEGETEIYSTGFGLRMRGSKTLEGSLDLAWPLASYGSIDSGDMRIDFSLRTGF